MAPADSSEGSGEGAWTLCIDFGTAFSKAAAAPADAWSRFEPSMARPLTIGRSVGGPNPFLLDSALFLDEDRILLGAAAVERAAELAGAKRQALRSFKTMLAAADLERALTLAPAVAIDPSRLFQLRDLIVLYLAYLTRAVTLAAAADPAIPRAPDRIMWRYGAPAWRGAADLHDLVPRLFAEARLVQARLGEALAAPDGVPIEAARAALAEARTAAPPPWNMGMIFEASAAAAYSSIGLEACADHVVVIDMGAGTTDVAALARGRDGLQDISGARVTLNRAGDFIDRILLNLAIEASPALKTPAQQAELWRNLSASISVVKESLFLDGRAVVRHASRPIIINRRDLERDKDFKLLAKGVADAYERGMDAILQRAAADGARVIHAVAVGGGAGAPFIQDMIKRKPVRAGKIKVIARPATPEWAHAAAFGGNLAPIFPQLAIAIGGALAPQSMLVAGR